MDHLLTVGLEDQPVAPAWLRTVAVRARASAMVAATGSSNVLLTSASGLRSTFSQTTVYRLGSPRGQIVRQRSLTVIDSLDVDTLAELTSPPRERARGGP